MPKRKELARDQGSSINMSDMTSRTKVDLGWKKNLSVSPISDILCLTDDDWKTDETSGGRQKLEQGDGKASPMLDLPPWIIGTLESSLLSLKHRKSLLYIRTFWRMEAWQHLRRLQRGFGRLRGPEQHRWTHFRSHFGAKIFWWHFFSYDATFASKREGIHQGLHKVRKNSF